MSASELLATGDCYALDGCYEEAITAYASCLAIVSEKEALTQFRALSHKSSALFYLARHREALADAQNAITLHDTLKFAGLREGETEACQRRKWKAAQGCGEVDISKTALLAARELAELNHRSTKKYDTALAKMKEGSENRKKNEQALSALMGGPESLPNAELQKSLVDSKPAPTPISASVPSSSSAPSKSLGDSSKQASTGISLTSHPFGSAPVATKSANAWSADTPKYQYYQSEKVMTISILEHNVKEADLYVDVSTDFLHITLKKNDQVFTMIDGYLFSNVDTSRCKLVIKDEKVLVKLRKTTEHDWHELLTKRKEGEKEKESPTPSSEMPLADKTKTTPYASHRDWDAIEKNIEREEKSVKPEGEAAMNSLFQSIYANADDDTKRAMLKSYQTSGGTVLSTNWDEVSKKDYEQERVAPKGMEWKNWNGDKLDMAEDD